MNILACSTRSREQLLYSHNIIEFLSAVCQVLCAVADVFEAANTSVKNSHADKLLEYSPAISSIFCLRSAVGGL